MIFINDIDVFIILLITIMNKFADDTKLGNVIHDQNDVINLQKCLDDLVEWAEVWGMKFNVDKCMLAEIIPAPSTPRTTSP